VSIKNPDYNDRSNEIIVVIDEDQGLKEVQTPPVRHLFKLKSMVGDRVDRSATQFEIF